MTQQVTDEHGQIHEFPDDATPEEMNSSIDDHHFSNAVKAADKSSLEPSFGEKLAPNILAGLAQGGHELINAPHNIASWFSPKLASHIPKQEDYDYAKLLKLPDNATLSDKLIQGLAQYAPGIAAPEAELGSAGKAISKIPALGRFIKKSIGNAIPISAWSAIQNPENPGASARESASATLPFSAASNLITSANPYTRIAARLGLSGLGAYGGNKLANVSGAGPLTSDLATVAGAGLGALGVNPNQIAKENMLQGVAETPYKEKLEAAQRLGLKYLTPAEASGNPFTAAQQGASGKTEQGSQILYNQGKERLETERKAINDLHKTIYDKDKLDPEVNALYKQASQRSVPQDFVDNLKKDEVFKSAVKNMESKPAYREKLKNVPENSIGYLDKVKQSLDDMIEAAPKSEARILKETKKNLVSGMDEVSPEYKKARSLAERGITRTKLEEALNEKDVRGTNFFNKVLKNDKNFNKTRFSLRNVPEAQQRLDDMRKVFGDLINPPTVRTAAGLANTGMRQNRNSLKDFSISLKNKLSGDKYDKAAIELITNPKWADELHAAVKIGNGKKKAGKIIDLLGRAAGAAAGDQKKPIELDLNNFAGYK